MGPSTRREVQRSTSKFRRTIKANFKLLTSHNAIPTLNPKTTDSTIRYQSRRGCVPGPFVESILRGESPRASQDIFQIPTNTFQVNSQRKEFESQMFLVLESLGARVPCTLFSGYTSAQAGRWGK
jgi:hypothetical protein